MLMLRANPPETWLSKVISNLDAVLVDHAHLERKAARSAISLQRYRQLGAYIKELTNIAIEELEHFKIVLNLLDERKIPFTQAVASPWISGLMTTVVLSQIPEIEVNLIAKKGSKNRKWGSRSI